MLIAQRTSQQGILAHFDRINKGDVKLFAADLREHNTRLLKDICKSLGLEWAATKPETMELIVKKVEELKDKKTKPEKEKTEAKKEAAPAKKESKEEKAEKKVEKKPEKKEVKKAEKTEEKPKGIELKINPEYKKFIPAPSVDDRARIKASFEKKGFDPTLKELLKVKPDMTILDGHTRYAIMNELFIPVTKEMLEIIDIPDTDVEEYMVMLNVDRRHLTDIEKLNRFKKFLPKFKEELQKKRSSVKEAKISGKKLKAAPPARTRDEIAKRVGTSGAFVKQWEHVDQYAPQLLTAPKEKVGKEIGPLHAKVDLWLKTLRLNAPETYQAVREGKQDLETSFRELQAEAVAKHLEAHKEEAFKLVEPILSIPCLDSDTNPNFDKIREGWKEFDSTRLDELFREATETKKEEERVAGPREEVAVTIHAMFEKVIKKHNKGELKMTECEAEFYQNLEKLIEKYQKSGK
jgi:hypothetical protein